MGSVAHQLGRYGSALRWLAEQLWDAFRWRVVRAVVAAQAGVLIVGLGVSLAVKYAHQLESGEPLRLGGLALPARDEGTLVLMVAAVLVVLLAGAGALFWAQRRIVGMAVELGHHVRTKIALAYGGELPEPADWRSDRAVWRALWVLQTRDARRTAIVVRSLLRNTVHVGIAVVALGALFALEPWLTLLLTGVMLLALVAYYYANMASARATRRYEAVAPGTRKGLHRLLPAFQTHSQPRPSRDELEAALGHEAVAEETEAFRDRFGAYIYAELLGFAIMGVALAALIAYMGRGALAGEVPWTRMLAYLVVLRIALNAVRSLLSTFAFFSRFYPSIDRLNRFFSASNGAPSRDPLDELALQDGDDTVTESPHMANPVAKGEAVEVRLPVTLSRYSLGLLAPVFAGEDVRERRRVLGHVAMAAPLSVPPTTVRMRNLLMLGPEWDAAALREQLGEQAAAVEQTVGLDPDAWVPAEAWARLPREAVAQLVLLAAEASERPVLAVDPEIARSAGAERLRQTLAHKVLLVCTSDGHGLDGGVGVTRTIVVSEVGEIVAVGSPEWLSHNLAGEPPSRAEAGAPEADADEEPDEE